ncbi:MAG: SAM-dependent methyltransferase, partial [Pseudomonadota bacterium]
MSSLKDRLTAMIRASGPMPVSAFMDVCLHDPQDGYYARRPGLGRDFITAPETSQVFGELIGLWAAHEWQALGSPSAFNLVELGPGRGTLMGDGLRAAQKVPGFHAALKLHFVEASPLLRTHLSDTMSAFNPVFADQLTHIDNGPTLILANEFLDCLPVRQFARTGGHWHERVVGLDAAGALSFGLAADAAPSPVAGEDVSTLEIQPGLDVLVDTLKLRLERDGRFRALFIDYGPAETAPGDTLRAYQNGEQVHPLAAPGLSDLTADVDFLRLKKLAEAAGLHVHGPQPQGDFLMRLGAQERLDRLIKSHPDKAKSLYDGVARLV